MKRLREPASRQGVRPRVAESPKKAFWALWTAACALGWVVGGAMSSNALTAMVGWGVAGLLQWGVIARALPRMRAWIVLTALGGGIGVGTFAATEMALQRYDPPALWEAMRADGDGVGLPSGPKPLSGSDVALWVWPLAGGMLGVAMGTVQWFLLRRRIDRAGWWIPTNVVAWGAGSTLVGVTLSPALARMGEVPITVWDVVPAVAGAGACMGAISGAVLVALFRRDPQVGE